MWTAFFWYQKQNLATNPYFLTLHISFILLYFILFELHTLGRLKTFSFTHNFLWLNSTRHCWYNNNIPLHWVWWGLPNHQMVYNICFIPKTKRTYIYKQYHENNILSVLKTFQWKLIHVMTLWNKFITFI